MKLMSLNIWGGQVHKPLLDFIKKSSREIDIFCFQEVFHNLDNQKSQIIHKAIPDIYSDIERVLPNHQGYFSPMQAGEEGVALFLNSKLVIAKVEEIFVYRNLNALENNDASTLGRNLQYVQIKVGNSVVTISHIHGVWQGGSKTDTPERLQQSKNIKAFLDNIKGEKLLCGDFNLLPTTKSLGIIEENMVNLIKKYDITSTRSHLSNKPDQYADYILVSPGIKINEFLVSNEVISDHLALVVDFSL